MTSEDVVGKRGESAVTTIVNLAEEAKIASEGVKAPSKLAVLSICKSLAAGGIAGGLLVSLPPLFIFNLHEHIRHWSVLFYFHAIYYSFALCGEFSVFYFILIIYTYIYIY